MRHGGGSIMRLMSLIWHQLSGKGKSADLILTNIHGDNWRLQFCGAFQSSLREHKTLFQKEFWYAYHQQAQRRPNWFLLNIKLSLLFLGRNLFFRFFFITLQKIMMFFHFVMGYWIYTDGMKTRLSLAQIQCSNYKQKEMKWVKYDDAKRTPVQYLCHSESKNKIKSTT